jgi:valyl-tRNA synthetase
VAIVLPEGALGDTEFGRLRQEFGQAAGELEKIRARLADASFTARAPAEVVAGAQERAAELERKTKVLAETLGAGA